MGHGTLPTQKALKPPTPQGFGQPFQEKVVLREELRETGGCAVLERLERRANQPQTLGLDGAGAAGLDAGSYVTAGNHIGGRTTMAILTPRKCDGEQRHCSTGGRFLLPICPSAASPNMAWTSKQTAVGMRMIAPHHARNWRPARRHDPVSAFAATSSRQRQSALGAFRWHGSLSMLDMARPRPTLS